MTTKPQKIEGGWSPLDIGGKDIKKDFIARCHVEVSAGGFLRFPLGSKGRNWLDERLMADFISDLLASERQRCMEACPKKKIKRGRVECPTEEEYQWDIGFVTGWNDCLHQAKHNLEQMK